MSEIAALHPALAAILWGASLYACVLGAKYLFLRRGDMRMLGISLLVSALGWILLRSGVELSVPVVITLPEGPREVDIPLIRTLSEVSLVLAVATLVLLGISAIAITVTGSDIVRLQKAVLRTVLLLIGVTVIWQMHFAGQFSIRSVVLGVGGASVFVIGLGLQRTLGNLFSGFDLQADKVVQKGDWVQLGVGGPEGVVADTSLRTTRIRSNDGQMMIIANGDLLGRQLLNLDQPDRCLRIRRTVGVSYEVPPTKVKDALLGVLQQDVDVLQSPIAPEVFVKEYGDSAITYELRFWVEDRRTMDPVIDRVMTRVWYALRERDLEIPFPIRTVHMVDMEKKAAAAAAVEKHANELERAVVRCPLFEERFLTSNERRELVRDSLECSLHPGEFAVRRGEMSDHMYLLLEGTVEVQPEGRAAITLQSPAWFGEIALLRGEPRTADVVGGPAGARMLRMSKMSVMPALQRNPQLAGEMSKVSNARREAAGVVDAPQQRTTLLRRLGGVLHGILIEMRPW